MTSTWYKHPHMALASPGNVQLNQTTFQQAVLSILPR